jgi:hypothetical protein
MGAGWGNGRLCGDEGLLAQLLWVTEVDRHGIHSGNRGRGIHECSGLGAGSQRVPMGDGRGEARTKGARIAWVIAGSGVLASPCSSDMS